MCELKSQGAYVDLGSGSSTEASELSLLYLILREESQWAGPCTAPMLAP